MNALKVMSKGLLVASLILASASVLAQQGTVTLEQKAEQWETYTDNSGAEQRRLVPATRVVPGAEVIYTNTYANVGNEPADAIKITNPVPEYMDYIEGSASGDNTTVSFSVDGGNSFAPAEELTITTEDGSQRAAMAADYTHIRWSLSDEIAPGSGGTVQFSAAVE